MQGFPNMLSHGHVCIQFWLLDAWVLHYLSVGAGLFYVKHGESLGLHMHWRYALMSFTWCWYSAGKQVAGP